MKHAGRRCGSISQDLVALVTAWGRCGKCKGPLDCPADLGGDGSVGTSDLLDLLTQWGTDPGGPPDFDGDGNVGTSDLLELLANWGPCP